MRGLDREQRSDILGITLLVAENTQYFSHRPSFSALSYPQRQNSSSGRRRKDLFGRSILKDYSQKSFPGGTVHGRKKLELVVKKISIFGEIPSGLPLSGSGHEL